MLERIERCEQDKAELKQLVEAKQSLIVKMKCELEGIWALHEESLMFEREFFMKKQKELEKKLEEAAEENKQVK